MWILRLTIALFVTMTIPVAGYFLSDHIMSEVNASLAVQGFPPFEVVCAMPEAGEHPLLRAMCLDLGSLPLLSKTSIAAGLFGSGFLAFLMLSSLVIGKSRAMLTALFPVVVQISLYSIVLGVMLQGAVLTIASYVGQSFFLGSVRLYLVAFVAIGVLMAGYKLLGALFDYGGKLRTHVVGVPLTEAKAPGLHEFVKSIAAKLDAKMPENIVVGLQPHFFATSIDVTTSASVKPLTGDTLYVSLPLIRLMTVPEFAAIIGHELGHFRGEDTEFTLKFAPVYAGLVDALAGFSRKERELVRPGYSKPAIQVVFSFVMKIVEKLAKIPARALLNFMMDVFARNERAVSRQRELVADKAGAEASSARALITALTKTSFYAELWEAAQAENTDRLNRGKATRNLGTVLEGKARYDVDHEQLEKVIAEMSKRTIPHPTDRHPAIGKRVAALGVDVASITAEDLAVPESSASLLLRNAMALGENLSVIEHKRMAELGLAPPAGRGTGGAGRHLSIIYRLAIAMSGSDGRISDERVRLAEALGAELFPDFEVTDFRQAISYAADIPELEALTRELNELLDSDGKHTVMDYLRRIAEFEGQMGLAEQVYIEAVAEELGIAA